MYIAWLWPNIDNIIERHLSLWIPWKWFDRKPICSRDGSWRRRRRKEANLHSAEERFHPIEEINICILASIDWIDWSIDWINREVWRLIKSTVKWEINKAGSTANTNCGRVGRGGNTRFPTFQLERDRPTNRPTDGRTKALIELRVRN